MPLPRRTAAPPLLLAALLFAPTAWAARPGPAVMDGWTEAVLPAAPPATATAVDPPLNPPPPPPPSIRVAPSGTHLLPPGAPDDAPPLYLTGLNWFGFENGHTFFDGLWAGDTALTRDFEVVAWRIRLLGFNAIRVPFSFPDLDAPPSNISATPCAPTTLEAVAASVARPGWGGAGAGGGGVPALHGDYRPLGPPTPTTPCNAAAPTHSTRARFLWALRTLARAGFYLVLDNHLQYDASIVTDPDGWVRSWAALAGEVRADPDLAPVTLLDLANEPDCLGLGWGPSPAAPPSAAGAPFPGMAALYHRAAAAVHAAHPAALLVIEGTGQVGAGLANNWGDGYATAAAGAAGDDAAAASAAPFFEAALAAPYAANLVLGPHLYPPSISQRAPGAGEGGPAGLAARLDASFGRLTVAPGYCAGGGAGGAGGAAPCRAFPWLVGEVGAREVADAEDGPFLTSLADYAGRPAPPHAFGEAAAPPAAVALAPTTHAPAAGLFWWSWNANSGDTGGLVGDDWLGLEWPKIEWLKAAAGLAPWADGGVEAADLAARLATAAALPLPTATALLATYASNVLATAGGLAGPGRDPDAPPPYVCLAVAGARPAAAAAAAVDEGNNGTAAAAPVRVDLALAASAEVCAPYIIEIASSAYAAAARAWNWRPLLEAGGGGVVGPGGWIAGVAAGGWQGLGPAQTAAGVAVEVVLLGGDGGGDAVPSAVAINGVPCAVVRA